MIYYGPLGYVAPHAVAILVEPPTVEPVTVAEAKLRAGLDWSDGDTRDDLMRGFIAAAREYVEQRTGLALLTQTRDIYFDALPAGGAPLQLPTLPLQSVETFTVYDSAGAAFILNPAAYLADLASGRIGLVGGAWPTDLRTFQPTVIRIIAGWESAAALASARPLLVHAVGLLAAHYATAGRDLATAGALTTTPLGFEEAIAPYVQETLA